MKKITTLIVTLITLMVLATSINASTLSISEKKEKSMVENLIMGINSDNDGLKKSCIYFAGKYEVAEVVPVLVERLKTEEDANTRFLISLSLHLIGDSDVVEEYQGTGI